MNEQKNYSHAKDLFTYLISTGSFYASIICGIQILWQYINVSFPDLLNFHYESSTGIIRNAIATILITWPVFLFVSHLIQKDLLENPQKSESKLRKWILYFTIFLSAIAMMIDAIFLINSFLSGELTTPFLLKIFVILLMSGGVFSYVLFELKRDILKTVKIIKKLAITSSVLLFIIIFSGFFLIGSPKTQRAYRFDQMRISNLQNIQYQITNYFVQKQMLPKQLSDLNDPLVGFSVPTDPETNEVFGYEVISETSFKLCADFSQKSLFSKEQEIKQRKYSNYSYPMPVGLDQEYWYHEVGRVCFDRTVDPKRLQKIP